jgi:uncharacterized protein with PIN domain
VTTTRCEDCGVVWLTPAARELMEQASGCLRCNGGLRDMTEQELQDYLRKPLPE